MVKQSNDSDIFKKSEKIIKKKLPEVKTGQLNEVKVLLVGDGGAGKTSLLKRLQGLEFKENEPQTHGINVVTMPVTLKKKESGETDAKIHLWDFGGQEIMHASHQFFLSKRSLYILVTDSRKDERIEHWLKHIRGFGGDSPVLVVINKTDQNPAYDLNRQHLRAKYPAIKGFFKLSCADGSGIDSFKSALLKEIQQMENMRSLWSKTWFDVKNALQNMKENYITLQKYYAICRDNHLEDESQQKTLLEYLHDLGVILHFPEFDLKEFQVLEPKWITEAVYKIMNSHLLAIKKGYLEIQMLENILNKESFDKEEYRASLKNIRYTTREQQYIVALMKAFQLCYDVERGSGKLLVPDLLAVAEPVEVADFDKTVSLRFIYRFDYLPSSILSSFISNMNRDIKAPHLQWRTGVVLENKNIGASALVKADKENKEIYVYVNGEGKQDYFPVIRHTFSNIINSYQELLVEELVPLPGYENTTISYKELKGFEIAGIDDYFAGNLRKSFSVATLLKGIERPSETVGERRDGIQKYRVARNTPPPKGNLLLHLELQKIGSVEEMLLEPAHRLNVITGDNGLGKTFLLECAWWALSGQWAGLPAYPMEGIKPGDARLLYRVGGPDEPAPQIEASYDLKTRTWNPISPAPDTPSLLLYARIDGSFAVWDSSKTDSPDSPDAALSNDPFYRPLVFSKNDVWDGYETGTGGKNRVLINGLIRDWITWQNKPERYPFEVLKQVLTHLSPPDMSPLEPDEPMRLPGDARDIPTLKHPYGRVSLLHVSAGVRRIVSLAYLMVWLWEEHKAFSKLAYHQPLQNMVVLIDEIEAHLHPQWQRSILPALLKVREALAPNLHIQFLAATHSPLVLASMEPVFEEQKDKLFHLALKEGKAIQLEEMPFPRCGRVDSWLMSDVFQLRHARSIEAEKAIEDAKKIQLEEKVTVKQVKEVSARLVKYLAPDDRFWPRWTFFAEEKGVRI